VRATWTVNGSSVPGAGTSGVGMWKPTRDGERISDYECDFPFLATSARSGHSISVMSLTHELFARKTKRPGLSLSPGTSVDQPSPKCCSRTTVGGTLGIVNGSSVLRPGTRGETVGMTRGSQRPRPARPTSTDKGGAPLSLADGVKFSCAKQNAPRLD